MEFGLFLEFPQREGTTASEAFKESFSLVDTAEEMGVESVWLAEYHFNAERVLSSPVTIASAIAARTSKIRIGFGVICLPLAHPVRIAEEVAVLDQISEGRIELGVGRGTFPNVHEGFNTPYSEARGRFEESLEVILKCWGEEPFSFDGEFFTYKDLEVYPKTYQQPHPPVHVGVTSAESFPITAGLGRPVIVNPSRVFTLEELAGPIEAYRKAWQDAGHEGEGHVGLRVPIYIAETEAQAFEEPRDSAMFSVERLGNRVGSYADYGHTTGDWRAESVRILGMTYDDWFRDKVVYGTVDSVTEKLNGLKESLGLDLLIYEINYGNRIPMENQLNSMTLFNEQVIPQLE